MKPRGKSPSEKFVSEVVSFIAGQHLYGKPRPSTFSLLVEARQLSRMTRELQKTIGKQR
jgi:hypothetical protein